MDEVVVPAGVLKTDQSYARVSDGADQWEVKDDSETKYVTPSTNNQTLEGNPKMDKFEQHDSAGLGMTITAMTVVSSGLFYCTSASASSARLPSSCVNATP